jgi:N-acetylglucosaminyl-diphospho-decaprenol L-rhamnosyltransferase
MSDTQPVTPVLADPEVETPSHEGATRTCDVAVVVVTHNSAHVVSKLLDSVPAALAGLTADVVVVDSGSTDDTLEVLASRGEVKVVASSNVGYAGGINLGVRSAESSDAILVLNPDVVLDPGSIPPLLAALRLPGVGIAAPQMRSADGSLFYSLRREPTLLRAAGLNWTGIPLLTEKVTSPSAYSSGRDADWATGAVLLVSSECHQVLGGWDESFFLYSEETQLCLEARRRGWRTRYVPEAVVTHLGGESGTSKIIHAMMVVNRVRLYRRRHRFLPGLCYYSLSIASELSWLARGHTESWHAVVCLLRPARRPPELGCSNGLLPS